MLGDHAVVLASEDASSSVHLTQKDTNTRGLSTASLEAKDTCLCPSPNFNSRLFLYTTAASATRKFE